MVSKMFHSAMNLCKSTKYSVFISKLILFSKLCKCIHLNTLINWMATNNWSLCNLWWHCPLLSGPMCRNSKQAQFFVCENDLVTHYDHFYSNYCVIYILAQQVLHSTATSYLTTQSTFHQKTKSHMHYTSILNQFSVQPIDTSISSWYMQCI